MTMKSAPALCASCKLATRLWSSLFGLFLFDSFWFICGRMAGVRVSSCGWDCLISAHSCTEQTIPSMRDFAQESLNSLTACAMLV